VRSRHPHKRQRLRQHQQRAVHQPINTLPGLPLPPEYLVQQRNWYLEHLQNFEKYRGKWIALVDNEVIAEGQDEQELAQSVALYSKEHPRIRPFLALVGAEDVNIRAEVLPLDVGLSHSHMLTTGAGESLSFSSIAHPREFEEVTTSFATIGRFKIQTLAKYMLPRFHRPVLTTAVETNDNGIKKIISFIVDTGSPLTFLTLKSIIQLGFL